MVNSIGIVYGTRPEFLKLIPLIKEFTRNKTEIFIINTGQHSNMLTELEEYFEIKPNLNLQIQNRGYTNCSLVAKLIELLGEAINENNLRHIIAQGDTFTVLAASMSAFLLKAKFYHVEAGLRTFNINLPFPEEFNRRIISLGASFHYTPTKLSYANLIKENYPSSSILVTGNTIIDLVNFVVEKEKIKIEYNNEIFITAHRRENLGLPIQNIALAMKLLATKHPQFKFNWSLHPNPEIKKLVSKYEPFPNNIVFLEPLIYPEVIKLMSKASLIISDSGGIQEEAPSLKKRILILRDETERPEIVECGLGILVGTNTDNIINEFEKHFSDDSYKKIAYKNPFGNGDASKIIFKSIVKNSSSSQ